ncbi:MAG: TonB-dependent receptor plug domain-containing protein [Ignavibacteriaceae bacterium]|nr:TonB-dependent receptor plug domain-containing protein [Ignavibacteriaceae bacterium]
MIKSFSLFIIFILQINIFSGVNNYSISYNDYLISGLSDSVNYHSKFDTSSIGPIHVSHDSNGVSPNDSLGLFTHARNTALKDSIAPIFQSPVSNNSFFLTNNLLRKNDYRYTPDYLKLTDFSYLEETGNLGFPDQLFIYGLPVYKTDYLNDGISLNDNPFTFFDLNFLQSETVDSIEIIPAPRGFLYGGNNKAESVNFISKDFISITPYTRIKYYQGAFGEAMLDGIFNSVLYKKLFGFLDITNRKLDQRYLNSDFSSWQVTAKLKYLISNSFNVTGSYNFSKISKGLNGGVNVDSLNQSGLDLNTYLYDEIRAPVVNQLTNMDVTQHNFNLRLLAKPFEGSNSDFNFYYKFDGQNLNDIRDNVNDFAKTKNKQYGLSLNQKYIEDIYNLNLIVNYEHSDINLDSSPGSLDSIELYTHNVNLLSLAGIAGINISEKIKASLFYKYSSMLDKMSANFRDDWESKGIGIDLNINTWDNLSFYLGYSLLQDYNNHNYLGNAEVSAIFAQNDLYLKLSVFTRNSPDNNSNLSSLNFTDLLLFNSQPGTLLADNPYIIGIGGDLKYKFWIMSFENNTSYYSGDYIKDSFRSKGVLGFPELYSRSGLYISDSLFSSNLNLKGGFVFTFYGKIKYLTSANSLFDINPAYKVDFTLAGRIRRVATVYFTWENLLDEKYYLVPYYPTLGRNIRFGIAWELFN